MWFGKNVKYDNLRFFGCKAFMYIQKDERSKLDAKSKQCIFIDYGKDGVGYKLYDSIGNKLINIYEVVFMEDQTLEYIYKMEKTTPEKDINLSNINPVPLPIHNLDTISGDNQNDEPHDYVDDQQLRDEVNILTNYDGGRE